MFKNVLVPLYLLANIHITPTVTIQISVFQPLKLRWLTAMKTTAHETQNVH